MNCRLLKRVIPFALLLLMCAGESQAQEQGLLLGLHYDVPIPRALPYYAGSADSLSRSGYSTLLISANQGRFAIAQETRDLLIPRNNRFWRVGTKRSIYNSWVEDFVWSTADNIRPRLVGIQPFNGEFCEGHRTQAILYADARYLSLEQRSGGYCEGGAHPWFFNTLAVVPIDSTTHTGLGIDDVLGEAAYEALEDGIASFLSSISDAARRSTFIAEADPANWGLVRRDGRWVVIGRLESAEAIDRGLFNDLTLPLEVPVSLIGRGQQIPNWRQIKTYAPDAVDAFMAPSQTWIVILHPSRLTVHAVVDGRIGPASLTHPLAPGTRAVMARWATGSQLQGWTQSLERLAQAPSPQ